ncbi:serine/threonine protein kinase [Archangium gephyra]|uniref:serine/threonine-protein kinase n=1 Tax=Archangium gephyra TaxID=48 RepID=UPI0035D4BCCA
MRVLSQTPHSRMYLARSPDGELVALKELLFALAPGAEEVEAFERESRLLRQLHHPRIPRYLASFRVGMGPATRLYLAQEYVSGESLAGRLESGTMQEAEARDVLRQVLDVLVYLQGLVPPILHRDIKPQNLIRTADGLIHLIDFGAARDLSRGTAHGATLVGTFGYMPLEQLAGTASPASDLFALGATVLHLLTGRHPSELVTEDYKLGIGGLLPVSLPFRRYLEKLVARDRSERFGSAREALAALDGLETAGLTVAERAAVGRGDPSVRGFIPRPEKLHVEDSGGSYAVWWSWLAPRHFMTGLFSLFWMGFLLFFLLGSGLWVAPFLLLHFAVGAGLSYSSLSGFLNKTRLQLTPDALEVRHGPLPWRGNRRLNPREVTHLYCTRDELARSFGLTVWPWPFSTATYSLHAVVGGRKVTLLKGLTEPDRALFLERTIEERLGLPDLSVDGELARRG